MLVDASARFSDVGAAFTDTVPPLPASDPRRSFASSHYRTMSTDCPVSLSSSMKMERSSASSKVLESIFRGPLFAKIRMAQGLVPALTLPPKSMHCRDQRVDLHSCRLACTMP